MRRFLRVIRLKPRFWGLIEWHLEVSLSCVETRLECDEDRVAPEHKVIRAIRNGLSSLLIELAYAVGVRSVGTRLEYDKAKVRYVAK